MKKQTPDKPSNTSARSTTSSTANESIANLSDGRNGLSSSLSFWKKSPLQPSIVFDNENQVKLKW
jgi:hypothetical protein